MPVPKKAAVGGAPDLAALGIDPSQGLPGPPGSRKPTRGALGGSTPRGARMKMPPAVASSGSRGGKKRATPKRKVKK